MSVPFFPNVEQLLLVLKGELPEDLYPNDLADDPDTSKRSFSSVELRAAAQLFANLYENLRTIDADKSVQTVTPDGINSWEKEYFAAAQDGTLPFETRRQNLLAKIRANGGISEPAIETVVHGILDPAGLPFEIIVYSGGMGSDGNTGGWILEESALDLGTFLGLLDPLIGAGRDPGIVPLDCDLDYAAAGLTADQLAEIQATAYTYEVRIFGNADANTLAVLDKQLTALEPARSTHVITNNAPPPIDPNTTMGDGWPISYGQ